MGLKARSVSLYFGMVIILTMPVWLLGSRVGFYFLPGVPISAIAVLCPALAACILSYWHGGRSQTLCLLSRGLDFKKAGWWLLLVALINPALFALAFLSSRLLGARIPHPEFDVTQSFVLLSMFLPAAFLEEIGWTGYALDRLQACTSPFFAALIVGLFWAAWHFPALVQVGRAADWIAWWTIWTMSARVIMVWIYNRTHASVFSVVLYHAMSNLCWQIYPVGGSHFDPRISGLVTLGLAILLTIRPDSPLNDRQ